MSCSLGSRWQFFSQESFLIVRFETLGAKTSKQQMVSVYFQCFTSMFTFIILKARYRIFFSFFRQNTSHAVLQALRRVQDGRGAGGVIG